MAYTANPIVKSIYYSVHGGEVPLTVYTADWDCEGNDSQSLLG